MIKEKDVAMTKFNIAITGATGVVGRELSRLLETRNFPINNLFLFASKKSEGKTLFFNNQQIVIPPFSAIYKKKIDILFNCVSSSLTKKFLPKITNANKIIDLSSAYRDKAPLIVPEINSELLNSSIKLISSPNCVASLLVMALYPLTKLKPLKRVIVSSYQAASGGGQKLLDDLLTQTQNYYQNQNEDLPYAFNLYLHPSPSNGNFYSDEEQKVIEETRKILNIKDLPLSVTCVRVPTLRAHSLSVNIEFIDSVDTNKIKDALKNFSGITVKDSAPYISAQEASFKHSVYISRIRKDLSSPSAIELWICGDQLLKGAALNAVQIAEHLQKQLLILK